MRSLKSVILGGLIGFVYCGSVNAQENLFEQGSKSTVVLSDVPSSSVNRLMPSAAELRQARALDKQRSRHARMDVNAWAGYDPSRPTIAANPFSQTRFQLYRPIHIWSIWDLSTMR